MTSRRRFLVPLDSLTAISIREPTLGILGFGVAGKPLEDARVQAVRAWVRGNLWPAQRFNFACASDRLALLAAADLATEVENGEMIAVMLLEGYRCMKREQNAVFNIACRALKQMTTRQDAAHR